MPAPMLALLADLGVADVGEVRQLACPSPMTAFLVSTKVPILPCAPSIGARAQVGERADVAPAPITARVRVGAVHGARPPRPRSRRSVVSGPIVAPRSTTVAPRSWVPGRMVDVRARASPSTSIQVVAGSCTVTPASCQVRTISGVQPAAGVAELRAVVDALDQPRFGDAGTAHPRRSRPRAAGRSRRSGTSRPARWRCRDRGELLAQRGRAPNT